MSCATVGPTSSRNDSQRSTRRYHRTQLEKGNVGVSNRRPKGKADQTRISSRPLQKKPTPSARSEASRLARHSTTTGAFARWTEHFPTRPGFYWFIGRLGRRGDATNGPELAHIL